MTSLNSLHQNYSINCHNVRQGNNSEPMSTRHAELDSVSSFYCIDPETSKG